MTTTSSVLRTWVWMDELSDETGIPLSTLRHWRRTGSGGPKSYRIGRRIAYDRDEVRRWVRSKRAAER